MNNNILVSSCLLGKNCKYNGGNNNCEDIKKLSSKYNLIEICPEVMGGLPTPRYPSEIINDKVINKIGEDVTEKFILGAKLSLDLAKQYNVKYAILKENSPSCGYGCIYDGTFSKTKIVSSGVTTRLLNEYGVIVYSEDEIDKLVNE